MADVTTETKTQQQEPTQVQQQTQKEPSKKTNVQTQQETIDTENIRKNAISEYLKSLGVDSDEALQGIVTKHKEDEEARNGIAELLGVYYFLRDLCVTEDLYIKIEEKSEIVI